MNTMKWLMKREYWEHKGGFFWAPAVVGAIVAAGVAISMAISLVAGNSKGLEINGERVTNLGRVVTDEQKGHIIQALSQGYIGFAGPALMIMSVVVFFYCLGSLFDERKDRSVLFWKSLPVSDGETVLSKVAMALLGAPLIALLVGLATSLVVLVIALIGAAASGLNLAGVLASPATYIAPFALAATIPVYMVWALPTVGWLMMVSSWARTKVFLWAVGVPVLAGVLLSWFNAMFNFNLNVQWFWHDIVARGLLSVVPGSWFGFVDAGASMQIQHDNGIHLEHVVVESWKTLASINAWVGAAAGAAMIFISSRLRRWKDEG